MSYFVNFLLEEIGKILCGDGSESRSVEGFDESIKGGEKITEIVGMGFN